jgi:hypothetical protein
MNQFVATQRKACELAHIARSSYRYRANPGKDQQLKENLVAVAHEQPRYGYRRRGILLERKE